MQDLMSFRRFNQGDRVRVVGPGAEPYPGAIGVVSSITLVGNVYRYAVEFQDGRSETFFTFELRTEGSATAL
jgi:hypothetical protein